jgi:glycerophosphoryl diester phosphodiesterase
VSRFINWLGRHSDDVAKIDTTGGTASAVMLTDNGVKKVLLRLVKNGVGVEMALQPDQAEDFHADLCEAIAWTVDANASSTQQKLSSAGGHPTSTGESEPGRPTKQNGKT